MLSIRFLAISLTLLSGISFAQPSIGMLDGEEFAASLSSISEAGLATISGRTESLALDMMRSVETGHPAARDDALATTFVEWLDGSQCKAQDLSMAGERVTLTWPLAPSTILPLDGIRRIRFRPPVDKPIYTQTWNSEPSDFDQLLLEIKGEIQVVEGFLVSIDAKEIQTSYEGKRANFPRDQVYGIIIAKSDLELPRYNAEARLNDQARLRGKIASFDGKTLRYTLFTGETIDLPWPKVLSLSLNADRLVFLSDMEPVEERKQPIVAPNRDWQRDLSVAGKTMRLGGKSIRKGLGLASGMRLVFEPASKYDRFSTTIGIDDETGPHGDCEYIIFKDREEVFRKRVTGTDEPEKISIDIQNADTVTIEIDYGADLDMADHANLAEACFIKDEEK